MFKSGFFKNATITKEDIFKPIVFLNKSILKPIIKARTINNQISNEIPNILHWSNLGKASWYDVAIAVGEIGLETGLLKKMAEVNPVKSDD